MGYKMKTTEKVENAFKRIKELLILISDWTRKPKEQDALSKEFNDKKLKMIEDLYNHDSEFATKEYIVQYDALKKKIYDLKK
jgi:hypothetical protein